MFGPVTIELNHIIVEIESVWMTNDRVQQFSIISRQLDNFRKVALSQLRVHPLHQAVCQSSLLYLSPLSNSSDKIHMKKVKRYM